MGHGNHWEAIGADIDATITALLPTVVAKGIMAGESQFDQPSDSGGTRREKVFAIIYPETPLRYLTLVVTDSSGPEVSNFVQSGYPYCADGVTNRIVVEAVKPWEGPVEAIISGTSAGGAFVAFFDPDFYKNRLIYQVGKAYDFSVAGLAYTLSKATQNSMTITEGPAVELEKQRLLEINPNADVSHVNSVELSIAELRYIMPGDKVEEDCEFRTIVEEVGYFEAEGFNFYRIRATLMIPDDIPFDGYIYVSESVLKSYTPKKGDAIEGFLWLQARLVSDQAHAPGPDYQSGAERSLAIAGISQTTPSAARFAHLHPGVNALGRTLLSIGAEVGQFENPDSSPDIPAFLLTWRGQEFNVWARGAIIGQEPEPAFTPEETARFERESKARGRTAITITIRCKDIGKGFMFEYTGLDPLFPSADLQKLTYLSKAALADEAN